jgi:hypothetical protein
MNENQISQHICGISAIISLKSLNHVNWHIFQLCFQSEQNIQTYFVIKIQESLWTQQYLIFICPVDQCTALADHMKCKFDYIYINNYIMK